MSGHYADEDEIQAVERELDDPSVRSQARLAQVLGWGDFRDCSPAQTEQFAAWAQEIGLSHLGNPHIREELFAERPLTV